MTKPDPDQSRAKHPLSDRRAQRSGFSLEKSVVNPLDKLAFRLGVPPPGDALLETVGRSSGKTRVTPVCDGLLDDTFWLIAAHGHRTGWVRNIEANARVRIKVHGPWRAGTAHILDDDDPVERERILSEGNHFRALCLRTSRSTSTDLLTVRVDLDPASDEPAKEPNAIDQTS